MFNKMLPRWCQGIIFFITLAINPITSTESFYRLVSKDDYLKVKDERSPFLNEAFFQCASKDDCDEVIKKRGKKQFKEVIDKETIGENDVVYKKIKSGKAKGTNIFKLLIMLNNLSTEFTSFTVV